VSEGLASAARRNERRLFGTDGMRGVAGQFPMDRATAHALGVALGEALIGRSGPSEVVLGMDTRESGPWLAAEVAGGLARVGIACRFAGIITTPGIAFLARSGRYGAGVMISASHNPYQDNGIKVFGPTGYKLSDDEEARIEQRILALLAEGLQPAPAPLETDESLARAYCDYLAMTLPLSLSGLRLVLDCAHGAAYALAPALFQRLGAQVTAIGCSPNGRNINQHCGSLHIEGLRERVLTERADLGVAFDGDADRAIFVAGDGRLADGDAVLWLAASWLQEQGRLKGRDGPTVVATVMSNLGLERALQAAGIRLVRTAVGDKYVLEEMLRCGAVLGGEQSGHVIFLEYATTGDGLLTALRILEILLRRGRALQDLLAGLKLYPQRLLNVPVRAKRDLETIPAVTRVIGEAQEALGSEGRVFVRYSGTEPVVRVMVEGPDSETVDRLAQRIAAVLEAELG
jgi:phosphoglucosamine mutase